MRFSAVAALCAAPLAFASSLQAELVARGAVSPEVQAIGGAKAGGGAGTNVVVQQAGVGAVSSTEIIIIWVNNGAGAATSTINQPQSVIASSTISAATHEVTVGGTALTYTPDHIAANVGDMVIFTFLSQNHTATQSAFATPCEALAGGMDSGFMPNINGSVNPPPQMAMQVTVATPLWFYCKQKGHCGKGMTFSINPQNGTDGQNKTQQAFQQLAIMQNGTGSTAVIAGGAGASSTAAAPVSVATSSAVAVAPAAGTMAAGTGTINANGACSCSCLCGTAAFPNAAVQGLGAFGGMSGAMPMSALEISVSTS